MTEQVHSLLRTGRVAKWFLILVVAPLALIVLYAGHEHWQNNRSIDAPPPRSVSESLEKGVNWLVNNREMILGKNNPMLWWFIKQSADITRDERLHALFSEYMRRHLDPYPKNVWRHLFGTKSEAPLVMRQLERLPDYNLYLIYAATCDPVFAREEIIQRQNDPEFCATHHPFGPACVTHQLIGVRLAQRRRCLDPQVTQQLVSALQEKIFKQLVWDPRVVDVYIQRMIVLAESGATHKIKPVWLQRVLDAQLADGGWDSFHILFSVNHTQYVGLTEKLVIKESKSNFHTTAQGVFLLSLLADGQDRGYSETNFP